MSSNINKKMATDFAMQVALHCVRNTCLEDFHAGTFPVSKTGDYSDVKIIDGEGREIAWNDLSRIDDSEMAAFMKEVINRIYTYALLADDANFQSALNLWRSETEKWDQPQLDAGFLAVSGIKKIEPK